MQSLEFANGIEIPRIAACGFPVHEHGKPIRPCYRFALILPIHPLSGGFPDPELLRRP